MKTIFVFIFVVFSVLFVVAEVSATPNVATVGIVLQPEDHDFEFVSAREAGTVKEYTYLVRRKDGQGSARTLVVQISYPSSGLRTFCKTISRTQVQIISFIKTGDRNFKVPDLQNVFTYDALQRAGVK